MSLIDVGLIDALPYWDEDVVTDRVKAMVASEIANPSSAPVPPEDLLSSLPSILPPPSFTHLSHFYSSEMKRAQQKTLLLPTPQKNLTVKFWPWHSC